jgi:anti-sigma regulatory factor (Ser/Thr protein kinase)
VNGHVSRTPGGARTGSRQRIAGPLARSAYPLARSAYPLPAAPESVRRARAWVRITLTAQGHHDELDTALLIMSELASNAVIHATGPAVIKIVCELDAETLTLGVIDYGEGQPRLVNAAGNDERGRGLRLVDALCQEWGCHPCDGGKIVFARLKVTRP